MIQYRLMIDGNAVYEIDEACESKKKEEKRQNQSNSSKNVNENKRK